MNNAPAGPWWFTAVVAGITALSTLLAGGLTTWLTLRYTNKRLAIEVEHQRAQERFKLLYADRLALFTKLYDLIKTMQKDLTDTHPLVMSKEADSMPERTEQGLRQCYVRLQKNSEKFFTYDNQLVLLGSNEVMATYRKFRDSLRPVPDQILTCMSDERFSDRDYTKILVPVIMDCLALTEALRKDLGSVVD